MVTDKRFAIGIDCGKPAEGTALAVVERLNPQGWSSDRECHSSQMVLHVRLLHRFPPGTLYSEMAHYLKEKVLASPQLAGHVKVVIDQTAIGPEIADLVLGAAKEPRRVILTGDHAVTESEGLHYVPKQHLIGNLQALLEPPSRLKFAEDLPETLELAKELINYRDQRKTNSLASTDAWREQPGEDLVFAVGLAGWELKRPKPFLEVSFL